MDVNEEWFMRANPNLEQYFLTNQTKLLRLIDAAQIRANDNVVEVGAGIGTVAQAVPSCASLTLVELDGGLARILERRLTHAKVLQGDALTILPVLPCDVMLSNLPSAVTQGVLTMASALSFRTGIVAVGQGWQLDGLEAHFDVDLVDVLDEDDFRPRQPVKSELLRLRRRPCATATDQAG